MSEGANEIIDQIFITLALSNMPLRVITHSNVQKCRNMYVIYIMGIKSSIKKKP